MASAASNATTDPVRIDRASRAWPSIGRTNLALISYARIGRNSRGMPTVRTANTRTGPKADSRSGHSVAVAAVVRAAHAERRASSRRP